MSVLQIDTKSDFDTLLKQNPEKLVVVDFYADWCGPCKVLGSKLDELASEHTSVIFCKVNVDDVDDLSSEMGIKALPTVVMFKGDEKVKHIVGMKMTEIEDGINTNM